MLGAAVLLAACSASGDGAHGNDSRTASSVAVDDSLVARAVAANAREQEVQRPQTAPDPAASIAPSSVFGPSVGFRTRRLLEEHFAKHAREFGDISRAEYLRQAQRLRDAPVGGSVLEIRRGDGTISRFDRRSSAFLAFDDDGTIRTFFKPNDGERYFRRQANRRAGR